MASLWNTLDAGLYYSASLIASCPSTPAATHGDRWIKGFSQTLRTEAVVGERGWAAIKFTVLAQHFYLGAYLFSWVHIIWEVGTIYLRTQHTSYIKKRKLRTWRPRRRMYKLFTWVKQVSYFCSIRTPPIREEVIQERKRTPWSDSIWMLLCSSWPL